MSDQRPPTPFDETLLSGYLDGELTQAEEQRVRLQLESDPATRRTFEEMQKMRQATLATPFKVPDDLGWDERPRGPLSRLARQLGWGVMILWALVLAAFALWQLASAPENLGVKLMIFGGFSGLGLLFVSVLLDRLRAGRTDRYRRVLK